MPKYRVNADILLKLRVIIEPSGCWRWNAKTGRNGYGHTKVEGRFWLAHRFFYTHFHGEIPDGLQIDHLCRNRWCVNPAHLEAVTQQENMQRGEGIAAKNSRKTMCVHGHILDGENLYVNPEGRRQCKTCRKARSLKYENKKKGVPLA